MCVSPPIAILAFLAVGIAGTTWLVPPEHETVRVSASLAAETYSALES